MPSQLPKRLINDRWTQHTAECTHCLAAVKQLRRTAALSKGAAAGCFAALCGVLGSVGVAGLLATPLNAGMAALAVAGVVVALAVMRQAESLLPQFDYVDFSHADNA